MFKYINVAQKLATITSDSEYENDCLYAKKILKENQLNFYETKFDFITIKND